MLKTFSEMLQSLIFQPTSNTNLMSANAPYHKWSSLFKSLPKNANNFSPTTFKTVEVDGVNVIPAEVIQEGVN